jgi:hypothetical protein
VQATGTTPQASTQEVTKALDSVAVKSLLTSARQAQQANDQKALANITSNLRRRGYYGPVPANE